MSYSFLDRLTASVDGSAENLPRQAVDDAITIFAPRYREAVRELLGRPLRRPSPDHNGDILNSVDIRLSDEYPPAWDFLRQRYGLLDPYNTFRLWKELRTTNNAAQYLLKHQKALNDVLDQLQYNREELYTDRPPRRRPIRAWPQTLIATQAQVAGLLEELQELYDDIRQALYETGTDVLGTYELLSSPKAADFKAAHGQIVLYWKPIVMAAFDLDLEIRDVARVALLHELVHAYANLGMDTDGHRWLAFVHSEPAIVEGVAEFYSYQYIRRSEDRSLRRAYAELLRGVPQGSPYIQHLQWLAQGVKNEQVRRALQRATTENAKKLHDFENLFFS
jgi:predicted Zn-dependent protease with MMP-like domain